MSVLAKNLKTLRKELGCTQSVMSDILKVGFRTYVRYEAGERDAPVAVLVKMARLGNLSLEQLLTKEVTPYEMSPVKSVLKMGAPPQVRTVNFRKGQVTFKNSPKQELMTVDESEKKLVSLFRKMEPEVQKVCLDTLGMSLREPRRRSLVGQPQKKRGAASRKSSGRSVAKPVSKKEAPVKKRAKPGRKKVNKKLLKEKIDKLKMITRSISKITVR